MGCISLHTVEHSSTGRLMTKYLALLALPLAACTVIEYPSVCVDQDPHCMRNQNARTLGMLGETEAAIVIMCGDPDVGLVIRSECIITDELY